MLAIGGCAGAFMMWYHNEHYLDGARSMNEPNEPIYQLEKKVWATGDTDAYYQLSLSYLDDDPKICLFYPLYMANRFNNAKACWDVYFCLEESYHYAYGDSALYKMDDKTRGLALQYLQLGAERGDSVCINTLNELKEKCPKEWLKQ